MEQFSVASMEDEAGTLISFGKDFTFGDGNVEEGHGGGDQHAPPQIVSPFPMAAGWSGGRRVG